MKECNECDCVDFEIDEELQMATPEEEICTCGHDISDHEKDNEGED